MPFEEAHRQLQPYLTKDSIIAFLQTLGAKKPDVISTFGNRAKEQGIMIG